MECIWLIAARSRTAARDRKTTQPKGICNIKRKQEVRMTGIIDYAHTETRSFADLPFKRNRRLDHLHAHL